MAASRSRLALSCAVSRRSPALSFSTARHALLLVRARRARRGAAVRRPASAAVAAVPPIARALGLHPPARLRLRRGILDAYPRLERRHGRLGGVRARAIGAGPTPPSANRSTDWDRTVPSRRERSRVAPRASPRARRRESPRGRHPRRVRRGGEPPRRRRSDAAVSSLGSAATAVSLVEDASRSTWDSRSNRWERSEPGSEPYARSSDARRSPSRAGASQPWPCVGRGKGRGRGRAPGGGRRRGCRGAIDSPTLASGGRDAHLATSARGLRLARLARLGFLLIRPLEHGDARLELLVRRHRAGRPRAPPSATRSRAAVSRREFRPMMASNARRA